MFRSIRLRLTVWYTALLACVLIVFAIISYLAVCRAGEATIDASLSDAIAGFSAAVDVEAAEAETPDDAEEGAVVREAAAEMRIERIDLEVFDAKGAFVAAAGDPAEQRELPPSAILADLLDRAGREPQAMATAGGESGTRYVAERRRLLSSSYTIVAGRSLAEHARTLADLRRSFILTVPLALVLAAFIGAFLSRKSLEPVTAMTERAEQIGASTLHERLPVANADDEIGRLARTFNGMLGRLEDAFEHQRRFMADASHELRTPVAIVRGESEIALSQSERSGDDYRESLGIVHNEGRRLTRIVDDLFFLARADAGQQPLAPSRFSLGELAEDTVHSVRSIAASRDVKVSLAGNSDMPIEADEGLIGRMLRNLLDNAIKHAPAGSPVLVSLASRNGDYVIDVEDSGQGIPEAARPHVFERFYRVDSARTRKAETDGAGLGLSIARWVAEAHGGSLVLKETSSAGTTFEARLPGRGGKTQEGG